MTRGFLSRKKSRNPSQNDPSHFFLCTSSTATSTTSFVRDVVCFRDYFSDYFGPHEVIDSIVSPNRSNRSTYRLARVALAQSYPARSHDRSCLERRQV